MLVPRRVGHFGEDSQGRMYSSLGLGSELARPERGGGLMISQWIRPRSPGSKTGSDLDGTHPLTLRRRGKHSRITLSTSESPIFPPRGCRGHATLQ